MAEINSKQQLEELIEEMRATFDDAETANERSYAANVLKGLIKEYEDRFGSAEETEKAKQNLRSVKNF